MFYANVVPVLVNLPILMLTGMPSISSLSLWIPAVFVLGPVGMYLGIVAVKHADAAMLGPYTLLRLIIGVVGGVVIFHELPDIFSLCGASLILVGCALSSGSARSPQRTDKAGCAHLPTRQVSFRIG
jgi:drug/metabolite transporter (DMT)-like permease